MKKAVVIFSSLMALVVLPGCKGGNSDEPAVDATKPLPIQGTPNANKPTVGMAGAGGGGAAGGSKPETAPMSK